ncbi:hypothetical protein NDU88_007156 [Pleurodeles waltl]|uniref:Uncharacterized protein n=1 Tax=Pleurodeles waltl TaxID=8319 RepID=A0AAV7LR82_PLEWA|nr:hypothetical protein NDU88_007156 [Pleurodeles waltl]
MTAGAMGERDGRRDQQLHQRPITRTHGPLKRRHDFYGRRSVQDEKERGSQARDRQERLQENGTLWQEKTLSREGKLPELLQQRVYHKTRIPATFQEERGCQRYQHEYSATGGTAGRRDEQDGVKSQYCWGMRAVVVSV